MSNVVLRIYIPRRAKVDARSWRHFGRKQSLSLYLLDKAWEAAIGEAELSQVMAGYVGGREQPTRRTGDIPDCLDICGRQEDLRVFCELYSRHLAASTVVWLTLEQFAMSPRWMPELLQPRFYGGDS